MMMVILTMIMMMIKIQNDDDYDFELPDLSAHVPNARFLPSQEVKVE